MRLEVLPPEIRSGVEAFIEKYNPNLTVDNFHPKGIKFQDELGQTVVIVPARKDRSYFFFTKANADIFVLLQDSVMLGWTHVSSVIDADTEFMMPVGSLSKMPKKGELKFAQECKHLAYFGGYSDGGKYMTCYGCGKEVVG